MSTDVSMYGRIGCVINCSDVAPSWGATVGFELILFLLKFSNTNFGNTSDYRIL